ncbi:MAG: hypothetical protein RJQ08_11490 [Salinisphaeraceae bacterium]
METSSDWSARRCPVNALQPVTFAGIQAETMVVCLVVIAVGKPFFGMIRVTLAALVLAFIYEKVSAGRMPNFIPYWLSSVSGHRNIRRFAPAVTRLLNMAWRESGLPPAPSVKKRYEP